MSLEHEASQIRCWLVVLIVLAVGIVVPSGCQRGSKATNFGNVHFPGVGTCNSMSIRPGPPPKHIEIVLPNGRRMAMATLTRDGVASMSGSEPRVIEYPGVGTKEKFNIDKCIVTFVNGDFEGLEVREGAKIINLENGKSVTLPASEADVRNVFGKPTSITYPQSQQP